MKKTELFDACYLSGPTPGSWHWVSQISPVRWLLPHFTDGGTEQLEKIKYMPKAQEFKLKLYKIKAHSLFPCGRKKNPKLKSIYVSEREESEFLP